MQVVTGAIVVRNGSVLLARRKTGQDLEGYWEFPGGKLEENETPQECLERELLEELGIVAEAGDVLVETVFTYARGTIRLLGIEATIKDDAFVLSVHDRAEWVPLRDLTTYNLAPADLPIAERIVEVLSDA